MGGMSGEEFMRKWKPLAIGWQSFEYDGAIGMSVRLNVAGCGGKTFAVRVPRADSKAETRACARELLSETISASLEKLNA